MTQTAKRRAMRILVYVFLLASAAAAFLLGDWLWAVTQKGAVPDWTPLVPPTIFTLFVIVYAVDRALLVRRRSSSLGRALFQVAFAIIFASLLWLWFNQGLQTSGAKARLEAQDYRVLLLEDRRDEVRAAACELLGLRGDNSARARIQELATQADSTRVRQACAAALSLLSASANDGGGSEQGSLGQP